MKQVKDITIIPPDPKYDSYISIEQKQLKVAAYCRVSTKIISKLAEANDLVGIIDVADFDDDTKLGSGKEKTDKLTRLIAIFEDEKLDFRKNRAGGDDIIGDAYEYLMRNFATESGKSKGQFYTPAEVSRIIAKVIGINTATKASQTIYDPTCGSGSLLIRAADEAPHGITIYGQEYDPTTAGLAKMNLVLHNKSTGTIARGNTLSSPQFSDISFPSSIWSFSKRRCYFQKYHYQVYQLE